MRPVDRSEKGDWEDLNTVSLPSSAIHPHPTDGRGSSHENPTVGAVTEGGRRLDRKTTQRKVRGSTLGRHLQGTGRSERLKGPHTGVELKRAQV